MTFLSISKSKYIYIYIYIYLLYYKVELAESIFAGTEIRTVDFCLNKKTRKILISPMSRISANTTRQTIRTRNENSNKIRNRKRKQDSSYSESVFEHLQQGK